MSQRCCACMCSPAVPKQRRQKCLHSGQALQTMCLQPKLTQCPSRASPLAVAALRRPHAGLLKAAACQHISHPCGTKGVSSMWPQRLQASVARGWLGSTAAAGSAAVWPGTRRPYRRPSPAHTATPLPLLAAAAWCVQACATPVCFSSAHTRRRQRPGAPQWYPQTSSMHPQRAPSKERHTRSKSTSPHVHCPRHPLVPYPRAPGAKRENLSETPTQDPQKAGSHVLCLQGLLGCPLRLRRQLLQGGVRVGGWTV